MRYLTTTILLAMLGLALVACGNESTTTSNDNDYSNGDADINGDIDTGTDGNMNTDTDIDADTNSDCVASTCTDAGAECGTISDGCGNTLDCGSCISPETCGGGGESNICGCAATTCADQNADCGMIPDGCGNTLDCGSCIEPETCGGGGANKCGNGQCEPTDCATQNADCGMIADGCGDTLDCGSCIAPETCGGGGTANQCGNTGDALFEDNTHPEYGNSGVNLNAIWGVATPNSTEIWIVGSGGSIMRWETSDGWSTVSSPSSNKLTGVIGLSSDSWFIVGKDTALIWDWNSFYDNWSQLQGNVNGVWGQASNHVYAIKDVVSSTHQCSVVLWSGPIDEWKTSGLLYDSCMAIGGYGGHVWIGTTGGVQHTYWSGTGDQGWNAQTSDSIGLITDVWAADEDNAWMTGTGGLIALDAFNGVWNRDTSLVRPNGEALNGVWGTGPDNLWVVGDKGLVMHKNESGWVEVANPMRESGVNLNDIWGCNEKDIVIVGDQGKVLYLSQ